MAGAADLRTIIPVWGSDVEGATATYDSVITVTNPNDQSVVVRVGGMYPVIRVMCEESSLPCYQAHDTPVPPGETRRLRFGVVTLDQYQGSRFGAIVIEADLPVEVSSEIYAAGDVEGRWEVVETTRDWITGSAVIPAALRYGYDTLKLFLVNPNPFTITVDFRFRAGGEGSRTIDAKSSAVVVLPPGFHCPSGCGHGTLRPGDALPLYLDSPHPYAAASRSSSEALPPIVRAAIPID